MTHQLEAPGEDESPEWDSLYRARGDEVSEHRPVFTGDVFFGVNVAGEAGPKNVMILQHPCAIRLDGVRLMPKLLVAEVTASGVLEPSRWAGGYYKQLPLAALRPGEKTEHFAAFFTKHHLVTPEELDGGYRVACMSQVGVNLLLQRWVHHNSRAVIPTDDYQAVSAPQFEEADLTEDWCIDREEDGVDINSATLEVDVWLSDRKEGSPSRRERLNDDQQRSQIRQDLRGHLRALRAAADT
jgi:hypothetical protein